ncbi:MAG: stage V sporulation protein SpoVM [Ruminococcus sp.]
MKVVLIDNPRFISCLLRMMFGIKKEKQNAE